VSAVKKFAWKKVAAAQEQLKKRMKRASRAKRSDYARLHEVRKAGKRVDIRHDEHRHEERQRAASERARQPQQPALRRCTETRQRDRSRM
jgi:hypothetical protein